MSGIFSADAGMRGLTELFEDVEAKDERNRRIALAATDHGYTHVEVARHLGMRHATVSRLPKAEISRHKT